MNVYDFDHTIYSGDSSVDFWGFVLEKKPYLIALLPFQISGIMQYLFGLGSKEKMKETFFVFLRFIPAQEMAVLFWEKNRRKIQSWYLRQKQDSDVIISASPEFLLEPAVCGFLGVPLIASRIDTRTGKFEGKNCYGEEKAARFGALYPDAVIDAFYSDSTSDDPLAKKARRSFMIKRSRIIPRQEYKPALFENIKKTYVTRDFVVFVFCGGMGTLTNFVCSLVISAAVNPAVAYVLGYAISLFTAYTLNAKLVFKSALSFPRFLKFVISYIPNFIILFLFVLIFLNIVHWHKIIVYALAGLFGLPLTFVLVKLFAFRRTT